MGEQLKRLTDEILQETVRLYKEHGSQRKAAEAAGIYLNAYQGRLKIATERGLLLDEPPAMPGFRISRVAEGPSGRSIEQKPERGEQFKLPAGQRVKAVSALVDEDGREIVKWIKTKENELDPLELVETLKTAFADYKAGAFAEPRPNPTDENTLTLYPLADFHIGMYAWRREVGENWDLKIAEAAIGSALDDLIERSAPSQRAVILGGGDLLHSDNSENRTARSGAVLQVDGRYPKTVMTACRLVVRAIDKALQRHEHVTVRMLPGNHDEHTTVAVTYFIHAWYRNEPRVTVDIDPSLYWWHRFGNVLLGATHGHTVKIEKMSGIMAHRRAEDWGVTKFRYVHGFHLHHSAKFSTEGEGVISEIHQAPIPQDAWHFGSGFLSGRSVQSITYHKDFGERSRNRVAICGETAQ